MYFAACHHCHLPSFGLQYKINSSQCHTGKNTRFVENAPADIYIEDMHTCSYQYYSQFIYHSYCMLFIVCQWILMIHFSWWLDSVDKCKRPVSHWYIYKLYMWQFVFRHPLAIYGVWCQVQLRSHNGMCHKRSQKAWQRNYRAIQVCTTSCSLIYDRFLCMVASLSSCNSSHSMAACFLKLQVLWQWTQDSLQLQPQLWRL